jgi:biotin carboxylase
MAVSNKRDFWLVAITAGRWQRHGIVEARKAGLKVVAIDSDPNAEGFQDADKYICMDTNDYEGVVDALQSLDIAIRGAVSFCSEAGMLLAAHVREAFNLPGPRRALCRSLIDKGIQRRVWEKAGVPSPQFRTFTSKQAVLAAIPLFGFPSIIKPTDSSGSRGVTKLESIQDDLGEAVDRAFDFAKSGEVVLENFMVGTEFTVEVFCIQGKVNVLAISEKKKVSGTRGTVARELATPDRPCDVLERIVDAVSNAFVALGYVDGPGHAEAILMEDESVGLVEVAGRGGGFMVFDKFVPLVSGVNIARLTAQQAVGMTLTPFQSLARAAVLRFFPTRPGFLRAIHGFDEANKVPGVEAGCFVKPGLIFGQAMADGDRLGYILSCAETVAEAQRRADFAEHKVVFDFVPPRVP